MHGHPYILLERAGPVGVGVFYTAYMCSLYKCIEVVKNHIAKKVYQVC